MPYDLSNTLVVCISSRALFDMSESDNLFRKLIVEDPDNAIQRYREFMFDHEDLHLNPGTGYPLVKALLELNKPRPLAETAPLVEVVVMSRNSPETGVQVLNTIRRDGLDISRFAFTGGEAPADYLEAFNVDLFLTANVEDAQCVADSRSCAVAILREPPENGQDIPDNQVRLAFDGDAVLFSEDSELVFKTEGLRAFQKLENDNQDVPLAEGPYATLLKKLAALQNKLERMHKASSVRIALVTSRNSPSEMRVIKTLRSWGVQVDEAFFLGGMDKTRFLTAFNPHIFFDDMDVHLERAASCVPTGKVPYGSNSRLADRSNVIVKQVETSHKQSD